MKLRLLLVLSRTGNRARRVSLERDAPARTARGELGGHAQHNRAPFSERSVPTSGPESNYMNSDLAFWGDMVVQGHYNGFRLVDVTFPSRPKEIIDDEECAPKNATGAVPGNQGDIAIYGNILSRSWNSNTGCGGSIL